MKNLISFESLPEGWAIANTCDVCEVLAGGPAPQGYEYFLNGDLPFVRVQDMGRLGDEVFLRHTADLINERAARKLRLFPEGSVLFTKSGASTLNNQRAILGQDSYVVSHIGVLIPSPMISNKWVYFWFKGVDFKKLAHSTVMPSLPLSKIINLEIPIPPTNEQHRIVAKIEALFSELDKGIESFKTAREQLKIYRQALLKHAFSGKLTEQWRAENADKLESAETLLQRIQTERQQRYQQQLKDWEANGKPGTKPKAPKTLPLLTAEELAELPELPEGWIWVKIADLSLKITDGEHFRPDTRSEGIYFLSAKDVQNHGVVFDDPLFIDEETAVKARLRCDPERNDILIVSRGATVGRMCIIRTDEIFCLLGSVILIKPVKSIESSFFLHGLKSPLINKKIIDVSGATAQQAIYLRDIQHVPIPLCSKAEQIEIVKILEDKLSVVDQLEVIIDIEISRSEILRQSILKKAFSGQLVPQDPNDEPGSVLLERIRAEKANTAPAKAKRTTNRKATA